MLWLLVAAAIIVKIRVEARASHASTNARLVDTIRCLQRNPTELPMFMKFVRLPGSPVGRADQTGQRSRRAQCGEFSRRLDVEPGRRGIRRFEVAICDLNSEGRGGRRCLPRAFTEHGALMAATILNSQRAVDVSIYVVRAFVRLRELAATHGDLAKRLNELEQKTEALAMQHDSFSRTTPAQLKQVFDALRELMAPLDPPL